MTSTCFILCIAFFIAGWVSYWRTPETDSVVLPKVGEQYQLSAPDPYNPTVTRVQIMQSENGCVMYRFIGQENPHVKSLEDFMLIYTKSP